jgi:hypothetical protein
MENGVMCKVFETAFDFLGGRNRWGSLRVMELVICRKTVILAGLENFTMDDLVLFVVFGLCGMVCTMVFPSSCP